MGLTILSNFATEGSTGTADEDNSNLTILSNVRIDDNIAIMMKIIQI